MNETRVPLDKERCQLYARRLLAALHSSDLDTYAVMTSLLEAEKCSTHLSFRDLVALSREAAVNLENSSEGLSERLRSDLPIEGRNLIVIEQFVKKNFPFIERDIWEALTPRSRTRYLLQENQNDSHRNAVIGGLISLMACAGRFMGFSPRGVIAFSAPNGVGTAMGVPVRIYNAMFGKK
jgi:hypothetical protein